MTRDEYIDAQCNVTLDRLMQAVLSGGPDYHDYAPEKAAAIAQAAADHKAACVAFWEKESRSNVQVAGKSVLERGAP